MRNGDQHEHPAKYVPDGKTFYTYRRCKIRCCLYFQRCGPPWQWHRHGNSLACGICHSFSADGRCISLLKILFTNECIFNCAYCQNNCNSDVKRASFTPDEVCELTIEFYRRNYIEGLFLSSGIIISPNYTMDLIYQTLYRLRNVYHFNGYIHVKAIPGADPVLVEKPVFLPTV